MVILEVRKQKIARVPKQIILRITPQINVWSTQKFICLRHVGRRIWRWKVVFFSGQFFLFFIKIETNK